MGGRNKYLLNGTTVQNKRITDLFCSVQLNVNNPHFLIMQGRITKVLNMKPPEILSMVEESAGTKVYETKRSVATKTVEKKDAKLNELTRILDEEISPKLEKLREERRAYNEFQRIERELQHLTQKFTAWQYIQCGRIVAIALQDLDAKQSLINELHDTIKMNINRTEEIDVEIRSIQEQDSESAEKLQQLEQDAKAKEKIHTRANAELKSAVENVKTEEKKLKDLKKNLQDDEKALKTKEKEMAELNNKFESLKNADEASTAAYLAAKKRYEALNAGMEIGDDGEAATLQEQLMYTKQQSAQLSTEIEKMSMEIKHAQKQLKEKQNHFGQSSQEYERDRSKLAGMEKDVQKLEKQLHNINYDENKVNELESNRRRLYNEKRRLVDQIDSFEARYVQTAFRYTKPEPNFNSRSVKGPVCKLVRLKDQATATAVETIAGGRLFNVIIDNETTGQKLLKNGQLQTRTTFIPLNKIQGHELSADTIRCAESIVGKENVQPALSLIDYNNEIHPAMKYIFGNSFVCRDLNVARKVAFHEKIKTRCVTLDGDVVDPMGTLSGGARRKETPILLQLDLIKDLKEKLNAIDQELCKTENDLRNMSQVAENYTEMKRQYELQSHELQVVRQRMQQTTHFQKQEEMDDLKRNIAELTERTKECSEKEKKSREKAKELEEKMKNQKGTREKRLKEAETEMKKLKKISEDSKNIWKHKEQDYETMKMEIIELQKLITTGQEQIEKNEKAIIELKETVEKLNAAKEEAHAIATKAHDELKELKHAMTAKNAEIQKKQREKQKLLSKNSDLELDIKKQSHDVKDLRAKYEESKSNEQAFKKQISLKRDDIYLKEAEEMNEKDSHDLKVKIASMNELKNKMSRKVNPKAQSMFEQDEKTCNTVIKKRKQVELDRKKFLKVIQEIDKKKIEILTGACRQISQDFGSIFSMLLPGANSKLQPPDGKTVLDGLEIKVSLGGMWKENLSELSGGQKSLIALSLILAMLLYKPAPIYILDEVDAALDLSHTQNIGKMLKKHFQQSQVNLIYNIHEKIVNF